mgnify:CR=1 FL=1
MSPDEVDSVSCSICMEEFADGDDSILTICSHRFHMACLNRWTLSGGTDCPLCRTCITARCEIDDNNVSGSGMTYTSYNDILRIINENNDNDDDDDDEGWRGSRWAVDMGLNNNENNENNENNNENNENNNENNENNENTRINNLIHNQNINRNSDLQNIYVLPLAIRTPSPIRRGSNWVGPRLVVARRAQARAHARRYADGYASMIERGESDYTISRNLDNWINVGNWV